MNFLVRDNIIKIFKKIFVNHKKEDEFSQRIYYTFFPNTIDIKWEKEERGNKLPFLANGNKRHQSKRIFLQDGQSVWKRAVYAGAWLMKFWNSAAIITRIIWPGLNWRNRSVRFPINRVPEAIPKIG